MLEESDIPNDGEEAEDGEDSNKDLNISMLTEALEPITPYIIIVIAPSIILIPLLLTIHI
jgi:hypothetical protein